MNIFAIILTLIGLTGLVFSIKPTHEICSISEKHRSGWYLLLVMIILFVLGYTGFIWLLISQDPGDFILIVAAVFSGGGWFVFVVTRMSKQTITDLQRIVAEKHFQARHDMLTLLPNRTFFYEEIEQLILCKHRSFTCLMLDLNDFKMINDTFGHAQGDKVLQIVAHRLKNTLDKNATSARIGGDEFVVLLPNMQAEDARSIAESIQHAFKQDIDCGDYRLGIGVSIGIVEYPIHGENRETLLKHADMAMYLAKSDETHLQVFHEYL